MATLSAAAQNAMINALTALLNVGGAGSIQFQTAGSVAVATLPFSATSFGSGSVGVATANAITSDTNAAGGTFTKAVLRNNAGTAVVTCTAGAGSGEFNMTSAAVGAGVTVAVSALTMTMPAT